MELHNNDGEDGNLGKKRKGIQKRSKVWLHFTTFDDPITGKQKATCNYYGKMLCAKPRRNGTSTMNGHVECCLKNPSNLKNNTLLKYVSKVDKSKTMIDLGSWKFDEGAVKRALAEMLIIDEDSFSLVEKLGFMRFCEVALPPTFEIPSKRTITKECYDIYVEHRIALKKFFKESNLRVSLTTDTWTSLQRITYMRLTAHFIDAKWKLHKKILCFCPVDNNKGDELRDLLVRCLKDRGLEKIYALTIDNALANDGLVRVLNDAMNKWGTAILGGKDIHMRCATHIVNLVVGEGTKEKEMNKSVTAIKAAIKYVRQSPMRLKRFKEWAKIESKKLLCLDIQTRYARQGPNMKNELNDGPDTPRFPSCIDWENVDHILKKWQRDVDLHDLAGRMRKMYGHKPNGEPNDDGPLYVAMVKHEMGMLFEEYKRLNSFTMKSSDCQSFDEEGSSSTSVINLQSVANPKNSMQTSQVRSDYKKFKVANVREFPTACRRLLSPPAAPVLAGKFWYDGHFFKP
ncbi:hypothetical protein SLEP1_g49461 [Rubroshorea leprosula]|uniref:Transposase n=1 Tax=Rubroshorea leprosula TaxID=152421 RepID=A0AAV5LY55_9ROSI|nr:hypothetical protein SLEP1_g49461 [Rubroshorea leprosula]